jgi:hypothetical protein
VLDFLRTGSPSNCYEINLASEWFVAYNFPSARDCLSGLIVVVDRSRGDAECPGDGDATPGNAMTNTWRNGALPFRQPGD